MSSNYVFSLQPTFTQGLIFGQLSILVLFALILKYLFLDSTEYPFETSSYHPRANSDIGLRSHKIRSYDAKEKTQNQQEESAEWFNVLLQQVVEVYRSKIKNDLTGAEGDEVARQRVEDYANRIRPVGFLDYIKVHSVDLGSSAPHLYNGRRKSTSTSAETEFDVSYEDSISVSLSTSYLFNYPMASFARLPVFLTISLSIFKSSLTITPPSSTSPVPELFISFSPNFTLDLTTTSLMGSRAKLANVPKLHELIQHQVRRVFASRAKWPIPLPGLGRVADPIVKEIKKEMAEVMQP
ncbi:maintenance of mitochondrial morphology protein 1 [Armillaria fumosa]|nr:maintenance of mitochondrial morphology protein 1 [Armillaria fumosa]